MSKQTKKDSVNKDGTLYQLCVFDDRRGTEEGNEDDETGLDKGPGGGRTGAVKAYVLDEPYRAKVCFTCQYCPYVCYSLEEIRGHCETSGACVRAHERVAQRPPPTLPFELQQAFGDLES